MRWNPKVKYTTIFWTLCISIMLCIAGLLWAGGAYAAEKTTNMHCSSHEVKFINTGSDYLYATMSFERGNFRELPSPDESVAYFYNIDNGKVLVVGDRAQGGMYIAVYKNTFTMRAKIPEYQDNCYIR